MNLTQSLKVEASRATAWRVITDVERWPEWTASVTRIERLDGGPMRVGSRARVEQPGLRPMVWTVTRLESENRFDWETHGVGIDIVASHGIEAAGGGLVFTNKLQMTGWLATLLMPFIRARVSRFVDMETRGWKKRCEALAGEASTHED